MCNHSKISKDVSLSNHVPLLKRSLETFIFRVKLMLAHNNVVEAFWMGNIKNRDLKGEVIEEDEEEETQEDNEEDSDDNDEDEENKTPDDGGNRSDDQSEVRKQVI